MTKEAVNFRWMCSRCGDIDDPYLYSRMYKKILQWNKGISTHTRLVRLQSALILHPDTHWKEIGRGKIRLYSTKDGSTVCEI